MIAVLDEGYVDLKESWGSDERIIEAARQSTNGGFVSWDPYPSHKNGDLGLLSYLWKHKHLTPFEMCGLTFEVKAPIMVVREWHRHRTQSYSEASARYAPLDEEYYIPTLERVMRKNEANKQANAVKDSLPLDEEAAQSWLEDLEEFYAHAEGLYQKGLFFGIPKELARLVMPVGHYTKMYASANLRNWLGFLLLRQDAAAQEEIRLYANAVAELIAERFPRTYALYAEGV